jgi:D-aspartate ligase
MHDRRQGRASGSRCGDESCRPGGNRCRLARWITWSLVSGTQLWPQEHSVVLVTDDHPLPRLSRYIRQSFTWPWVLSPQAGEWLIEFAAQHDLQNWLLIPCADAEAKCVAENLARLRTVFKVVSSGWTDLRKVSDKQLLPMTAAAAGIGFPKNYRVRSVEDFANIEVQFPVVLKPAMRMERNAFTSAKAWRADTRDELVELYRKAALLVGHDEVVVQELIPGGGEAQFSYAALWFANAPVVEMSARRTRQYPIEFSHTSTFVEVIDNEGCGKKAVVLNRLRGPCRDRIQV